MKLSLHAVIGPSEIALPNTDALTTADIAAVPLVGDKIVVPGHPAALTVQSRTFLYAPTGVLIALVLPALPPPPGPGKP